MHLLDTSSMIVRIFLNYYVPQHVPDNDGRTSPPHRSYLIYTLVHRTEWSTDNVDHHNRRAS